MFVNRAAREINLRVVLFGLSYSGRATALQHFYDSLSPENRGKMVTAQTQTERTLFFDFVPAGLGEIRGHRLRVHLYCLTGEMPYPDSERLLLKGADGVAFLVDSQLERIEANQYKLGVLETLLREQGRDPASVPTVLLLNKRSLANAAPVERLRRDLAFGGRPWVETEATTGAGLWDGLKTLVKQLLVAMGEGQLVEAKMDPEAGREALDMTGRLAVLRHLGEFCGEACNEYAPRSLPPDRPYFIVLEHEPAEGRPYWTYGTAGLSLRPQPAEGPDPFVELVAYSPVGDSRVAAVLMALAWQIALVQADGPAYCVDDTLDLQGLELCHTKFVLALAPETDDFHQFPDVKRRDHHLGFLLAVSNEHDTDLRVRFMHVVPVTDGELTLANTAGTPALLDELARRGRQRFDGWPAGS